MYKKAILLRTADATYVKSSTSSFRFFFFFNPDDALTVGRERGGVKFEV